jgi:hypothetical protein
MAGQPPENGQAPIILDNCVGAAVKADPSDWPLIPANIQSLRRLKNRIFRNTLAERSLNLFQP